jgi:hypothetical protein
MWLVVGEQVESRSKLAIAMMERILLFWARVQQGIWNLSNSCIGASSFITHSSLTFRISRSSRISWSLALRRANLLMLSWSTRRTSASLSSCGWIILLLLLSMLVLWVQRFCCSAFVLRVCVWVSFCSGLWRVECRSAGAGERGFSCAFENIYYDLDEIGADRMLRTNTAGSSSTDPKHDILWLKTSVSKVAYFLIWYFPNNFNRIFQTLHSFLRVWRILKSSHAEPRETREARSNPRPKNTNSSKLLSSTQRLCKRRLLEPIKA